MRRVVVTGVGVVSALGSSYADALARLHTFANCVAVEDELAQFKGLNSHLGARAGFARPAHWTRKTVRTMGTVAEYALASAEQAVADAARFFS